MKKTLAFITLAGLLLAVTPVLAQGDNNSGHMSFGARIGGFFHGWHWFDKNPANFELTGTAVSTSSASLVVNEDVTVHIANIANGQVTVNTDANTKITGKSNASMTLGQIVAGDRLIVSGTVSGTTLTATKINDLGLPPAKPVTTNGKVSAVSATSITITNGLTSTSQTFVMDAGTKVVIDGTNKTAADIAVGDAGTVKSKANGSVFTATMINLFR